MNVQFVDLKAQYLSIRDEILEAIQAVMGSTAFAGGPFVEQFEKEFAEFCRSPYAIGVGSGTEALWLALKTLGIGEGDEVITVPNTFIATAEAISFCGATPVFVDVDDKTYTMDPEKLEDYLKIRRGKTGSPNRLKAVVPVHLYGQMADMDPIMEIARAYDLFVVEDACQAHGAEYKGRRAGSIGDAGCFSFYPGKNIGAYGEAGAITTKDPVMTERIRTLRDHGQTARYYHETIGWNARMDGLQGAVLSVKLRHIDNWNNARIKNARFYDELLSDVSDALTPKKGHDRTHVFHIYAILVQNRDALIAWLKKRDIHCAIHYPVPVHLQAAYGFLDLGKGAFPVSEKCAQEVMSLPMFAELTENQMRGVVDGIKEFTQKKQGS